MLETLTLWLIGLEALLLPHVLWFFSRRYRHALTYVWQVYLLRRKDVEEEGKLLFVVSLPTGTASVNSAESDLGCTSSVYYDNVAVTSQKPFAKCCNGS